MAIIQKRLSEILYTIVTHLKDPNRQVTDINIRVSIDPDTKDIIGWEDSYRVIDNGKWIVNSSHQFKLSEIK